MLGFNPIGSNAIGAAQSTTFTGAANFVHVVPPVVSSPNKGRGRTRKKR